MLKECTKGVLAGRETAYRVVEPYAADQENSKFSGLRPRNVPPLTVFSQALNVASIDRARFEPFDATRFGGD